MSQNQKYLKSLAKMREQFNPMVGITMASVVSLRDRGYWGDHSLLQWFYHRMMKSSSTLASLRQRREAAIQRLDWDIHTTDDMPAGATEAQAEAQATLLRAAYDKIDNLAQSFRFLSLAPFHGYCHMQKHRDETGAIIHLEPLDQWNWIKDGYRGGWFWNPLAMSTSADVLRDRPGAAIDLREFVIMEYDIPIMETCLPMFIRENIGLKDWSHFVDIYGIPGVFIIGPPNIPPDKEEEYKESAQAVADGGSGYLPNGSTLNFATDPRNQAPFKEYLDDQRSQMVLAGTGGKLTMLNEATGLGSGNADAHQDAFDEIAEAESARISEAFQLQIDKEILDAAFPGQPHLVYFKLGKPDEADPVKQADIIQKLSAAGFDLDPDQVSERTGFKVTKKEPIAPVVTGMDTTKPGDKPDPATAAADKAKQDAQAKEKDAKTA